MCFNYFFSQPYPLTNLIIWFSTIHSNLSFPTITIHNTAKIEITGKKIVFKSRFKSGLQIKDVTGKCLTRTRAFYPEDIV